MNVWWTNQCVRVQVDWRLVCDEVDLVGLGLVPDGMGELLQAVKLVDLFLECISIS